jgi:hypothetical protein
LHPQVAGLKHQSAGNRSTIFEHPAPLDSSPVTFSLLSSHVITPSCTNCPQSLHMPHSHKPTMRSTPTNRTRSVPRQGAILELDHLNEPYCNIAYSNITPTVTCISSQTIFPPISPPPFIPISSSSTPPSPSIT